jgi:hypothetical protein
MSDAVAAALRAAATAVGHQVRGAASEAPVILIDGRSGAGKTTVAAMVCQEWEGSLPPQRVALDDLYPGWSGLDAGARMAAMRVIRPHAHRRWGSWRRWDWNRSRYAESHAVDPRRPLVVEGTGVLTAATDGCWDVAVWLDSPTPARRARALTRDGDRFAPHWEAWARQEDEHIARHNPAARASLILRVP